MMTFPSCSALQDPRAVETDKHGDDGKRRMARKILTEEEEYCLFGCGCSPSAPSPSACLLLFILLLVCSQWVGAKQMAGQTSPTTSLRSAARLCFSLNAMKAKQTQQQYKLPPSPSRGYFPLLFLLSLFIRLVCYYYLSSLFSFFSARIEWQNDRNSWRRGQE